MGNGKKRRMKGEGTFFYSKSHKCWFVAPPGMKRRQAKTKGKAIQLYQEMLQQPAKVIQSELTVQEYIESWLEWIKENRSPSTYDSYSGQMKRHVIPKLGHLFLCDLNTAHIDSWLLRLNCNPPTKLACLKPLKSALERAKKKGIISVNPCDAADRPVVDKKEKQLLTLEEIRKILVATRDTRYGALFRLAFLAGPRQGELFGLRWKCVDWERKEVRINFQLTQSKGKTYARKPKTDASNRVIPVMDEEFWQLLNERRRQAVKDGFAKPDDYVFLSAENRPIRRNNFYKLVWTKLLDDLGIERRGMHQARDTVITEMLANRQSPKAVAGIVGHSQVSTTLNVYAQYRSEDAEKAIDTMSQAIGG